MSAIRTGVRYGRARIHPVILDLLDRLTTPEAIAALQAVLNRDVVIDDFETLDDPAFAAKYAR